MPSVGSEWAICPVCGRPVSLRSVPWPGEPAEWLEHLSGHDGPPLTESRPDLSPGDERSASPLSARPRRRKGTERSQ